MPATYYPPVGFYFSVQFQGVSANSQETSFMEVSGLNAEVPIEELQEGGELGFRHKLPDVPKYPNLVLKRGYLADSSLISWVNDAIQNFTFKPATVMVSLLNEKGQALATWTVYNAAPVKWSISEFKSQDNAVAVETLELAYTWFKRTT